MNPDTLFKVLALLSANNEEHGDLTGAPVQFLPDGVMHPKASLRIDLNDEKAHVGKPNESNIFSTNVPINPTDSGRENEVDGHENEITAIEVWHDEIVVGAKPYKPYMSPEVASEIKHLSPRTALENRVKSIEEQSMWRFHNFYVRVGEYHDYNYQKYQEIQYLSYSEKEKEKIIIKSQELKDAIMAAYVRVRVFCKVIEKYRCKLTLWSDDSPPAIFNASSIYWPQPTTIPETWYLLYNVETIITQLFSGPRPPIHTFYDEKANSIRMMQLPTIQMNPRSFIPVPQYNIHNNNALDRLLGVVTTTNVEPKEFEQATFSKDEYEQQVIVFYMFKYYEYKIGDLARHVKFISKKLEELKANTDAPDLIQIKQQTELLAKKLLELQHATVQMETYRTNPELTNVYNAEAAAIRFLPGSKHILRKIGDHDERVAMKMNDEVLTALQNGAPIDLATAGSPNTDATVELPTPLEWDKNLPWN